MALVKASSKIGLQVPSSPNRTWIVPGCFSSIRRKMVERSELRD